jgi:hypothetical protein
MPEELEKEVEQEPEPAPNAKHEGYKGKLKKRSPLDCLSDRFF